MDEATMVELAGLIGRALRGDAAAVAPQVSALKQRFPTVRYVRGA
jgi:hypothetical protein